jgi:hypothetical protein
MSRNVRKLKNGESYKKVVGLLAATNDFTALKNVVIRRLNTARIAGFQFSVDYRGDPTGDALIDYGEGEECVQQRTFNGFFHLRLVDIVKPSEIENIVRLNFGVTKPGMRKPAVPTYFCNALRVEEILKERMDDLLGVQELIIDTNSRLRRNLEEARQSDEYRAGLRSAREDHMVEEILKTLQRFNDASPETLKRALGQYVVHSVMDV